jgi:hypothetical protein
MSDATPEEAPVTPFDVIRTAIRRAPAGQGGETRLAAQNVLDHLERAGFKIVRKREMR